jgi:hypothetical protein
MGFAAAAMPIVCQLAVWAMIKGAPKAFPEADKSFFDTKFWPIQIILLSLAICGTAFVDYTKITIDRSTRRSLTALKFVFMIIAFGSISVIFSISLLIAEISSQLLTAMIILGAAGLWLAYGVEIDIGLVEAGVVTAHVGAAGREGGGS